MKAYLFPITLLVIAGMIAHRDSKRKEKEREAQLLSKHGLDPENMRSTVELVNQMRVNNARPVMAMTSMYLPRIVEEFPDFNFEEIRERSEVMLTSYLRAIDQNNPSLFKYGSKELEQTLRSKIEMNIDAGLEENYDLIKINRTEIAKYLNTTGRQTIYLQSSVECVHYTLKDGVVVSGNRDQKYQTRFEIELVYVQDAALVDNDNERVLGVNCPNCSAPVTKLGHKYCEYCGSRLIDYNAKTFSFVSIAEK